MRNAWGRMILIWISFHTWTWKTNGQIFRWNLECVSVQETNIRWVADVCTLPILAPFFLVSLCSSSLNVHLSWCLCDSSHRGRSGHVAEKIKVVDILWGEPRNEEERESPVTHRDNEICTVMKAWIQFQIGYGGLHGWVGAWSEIYSQRQFVLRMARNNYPLVSLSENGSKMNRSWLVIIEWVKGYSVQ